MSTKKLYKKSASGGSSKHHSKNSDSGIADDYESQYNNPAALREALHAANEEVAKWKGKYQQANADLASKNKELKETQGQWRGLVDRNKVLEDDKKALVKEKRDLQKENESLREELKRKRASPSRGSPKMSGALPEEPPKLRRRDSKREKDTAEKQTKRLSQRFDFDNSSEAATAGSRGSKRESYVEGWGRGGTRRLRSNSVSAPTNRLSGHYTMAPEPSPIFTPSPRQPVFASVPRRMPDYGYEEDGTYHGEEYPLPRGRR